MVKTKECYTKKKKDGGNYTTCVEGQKKKTKKIKKIAVIRKKKKPAPKKMSAGMSVLMTSGLMQKIGKAAIPKEERERRGRVLERELDKMFNTLQNKNEKVFHNNITANYSSIAGLKRTIKGREKVLERYKKKTENYKLIMRKKYKSPRQRGRWGSETAVNSDGVKMLESLISSLKQRLKERMEK